MITLDWCLKQKNGIELIEPNDNLSQAYFNDADDSVKAMLINKGKWQVVTAYYSCYNALYALLMKAGIKCEIHDCTIKLMETLNFNKDKINFMILLKKERIEVQYYLKVAKEVDVNLVKDFVVLCKQLARELKEKEVKKVRELVKND